MTPDFSSPPASPTSRSGVRTPDSAPSPSRARQRLRQSRRTSRCSGATARAAVPAERACTASRSSVRVSRRSAAAQSPRRLHLSRVADVDSPIQNAGGKCPSDRLRGSVLTPHASLMQDVPCLPLSGPSGEFRGQPGPQGCWTECMLWERPHKTLTLFMFLTPSFAEHTARIAGAYTDSHRKTRLPLTIHPLIAAAGRTGSPFRIPIVQRQAVAMPTIRSQDPSTPFRAPFLSGAQVVRPVSMAATAPIQDRRRPSRDRCQVFPSP